MKTALPEMPRPTLQSVQMEGVGSIGLPDRPGQPLFIGRDGQDMDVVVHQTIGENANLPFLAPAMEKLSILLKIGCAEKDAEPTIGALCDVMGDPWQGHTGDSGHECGASFGEWILLLPHLKKPLGEKIAGRGHFDFCLRPSQAGFPFAKLSPR